MKISKVSKECWCTSCDNSLAEVEISDNGNFHPSWAQPTDGEIELCADCFNKLKRLIIEFEI
nr:MAG TPA: hypothetical protein [Caudoviricetes sp.]